MLHGTVSERKVVLKTGVKNAFRKIGVDLRRANQENDRLERLTCEQWTLESLEEQITIDPVLQDFFRYLIVLPDFTNSSRLLTDRVAHYFLGDNRYFVEVGAWDPVIASDTYWLESVHGWEGLQVEPNQSYAAMLREQRQTTVIQAAITPSIDISKPHFLHGSDDQAFVSTAKSDCEVQVVNLASLIRNSDRGIDALFMDIEGFELPVLDELTETDAVMSFACVETIWNHDKIVALMKALGFQETWRFMSGYNSWFVKADLLDEKARMIK